MLKVEAKDKQLLFESRLKNWGKWRREFIQGLGHKSGVIESMIEEQFKHFDKQENPLTATGVASLRGKDKSKLNNVWFLENAEAQIVDRCYQILITDHRQEMGVVSLSYVQEWSLRQIERKSGITRYYLVSLKQRGEILIEGLLSYALLNSKG